MAISLVCKSCTLYELGGLYGVLGLAIAHEVRLFGGDSHVQLSRMRDTTNSTAWVIVQYGCLFCLALLQEPLSTLFDYKNSKT